MTLDPPCSQEACAKVIAILVTHEISFQAGRQSSKFFHGQRVWLAGVPERGCDRHHDFLTALTIGAFRRAGELNQRRRASARPAAPWLSGSHPGATTAEVIAHESRLNAARLRLPRLPRLPKVSPGKLLC